jgi:hypothetical protein
MKLEYSLLTGFLHPYRLMLMHLTYNQKQRIANIFDNAGQVSLGGAVLPFLMKGNYDIIFLSGLAVTIFLWIISVALESVS